MCAPLSLPRIYVHVQRALNSGAFCCNFFPYWRPAGDQSQTSRGRNTFASFFSTGSKDALLLAPPSPANNRWSSHQHQTTTIAAESKQLQATHLVWLSDPDSICSLMPWRMCTYNAHAQKYFRRTQWLLVFDLWFLVFDSVGPKGNKLSEFDATYKIRQHGS